MSQSITVAVGSPDDVRSLLWRLWVQGDEVYFGPRLVLPYLKASLHKTGNWHIKLGKTKVERWHRPKDRLGVVDGLMVLVDPFAPKTPFRNKAIVDPDIKWIALPPHGKLVTLVVAIALKGASLDPSIFPVGDRILAKLKKQNGEHALLIAHDMELTMQLGQKFTQERSKFNIDVQEGRTIKAQPLDTTRALLTFPPGAPGEMPSIYDLSLDWNNVVSDFELQ